MHTSLAGLGTAHGALGRCGGATQGPELEGNRHQKRVASRGPRGPCCAQRCAWDGAGLGASQSPEQRAARWCHRWSQPSTTAPPRGSSHQREKQRQRGRASPQTDPRSLSPVARAEGPAPCPSRQPPGRSSSDSLTARLSSHLHLTSQPELLVRGADPRSHTWGHKEPVASGCLHTCLSGRDPQGSAARQQHASPAGTGLMVNAHLPFLNVFLLIF